MLCSVLPPAIVIMLGIRDVVRVRVLDAYVGQGSGTLEASIGELICYY